MWRRRCLLGKAPKNVPTNFVASGTSQFSRGSWESDPSAGGRSLRTARARPSQGLLSLRATSTPHESGAAAIEVPLVLEILFGHGSGTRVGGRRFGSNFCRVDHGGGREQVDPSAQGFFTVSLEDVLVCWYWYVQWLRGRGVDISAHALQCEIFMRAPESDTTLARKAGPETSIRPVSASLDSRGERVLESAGP